MTRLRWIYLLLAGGALVLGSGIAAAVVTRPDSAEGPSAPSAGKYRGSEPPATILLPSFRLRDSSGLRVRSADLRGKVVLVTFLETRCKKMCPIIAAQVARGLRLLSPQTRRHVVALAISTQPHDDTAQSAQAFLRRHRAERELRYLIGSERELRPVWSDFAVLPALDSGSADVHSASVRIFNRRGVWVSTLHAGVDLSTINLRHDLTVAMR